jgi:diaphanous 1
MLELPLERKRYLLRQNQEFLASTSAGTLSKGSAPQVSHSERSGSALLPRLVPQLTGGTSLMNRFSIPGWGASNATPPLSSADSSRSSGESDRSHKGDVELEKITEEIQPLQPQNTGGLWSSWWASSGGDKGREQASHKEMSQSAKSYADGIHTGKLTEIKLVKHLISLRVHLSTAKLAWIEEFVNKQKGLDVLGVLLSDLVGKGGKGRVLESTVLLEVIKCLRVLLNTEVSSPFWLP